jgi:hypothetical protein
MKGHTPNKHQRETAELGSVAKARLRCEEMVERAGERSEVRLYRSIVVIIHVMLNLRDYKAPAALS